MFHARTKHIEVHNHYVWEKVLAREIDMIYVNTNEQVANIFTKSLRAEKQVPKYDGSIGYWLELEGEC